MISGTFAAIAALKGARSAGVGAPPAIVADPRSVFTVAPPRPGKCLTVGLTPPASQPPIAARVAVATRCGSRENSRPLIAAPSTDGTSATGASDTLIPTRRSATAAALASRPGTCRLAGAVGGAHSTLRITPPSWSVQTIGIAPPARPDLRSAAVNFASCSGDEAFSLNRIAPDAQPF